MKIIFRKQYDILLLFIFAVIVTPTVELNALAMKRGEPTVYSFLEPPKPGSATASSTPSSTPTASATSKITTPNQSKSEEAKGSKAQLNTQHEQQKTKQAESQSSTTAAIVSVPATANDSSYQTTNAKSSPQPYNQK